MGKPQRPTQAEACGYGRWKLRPRLSVALHRPAWNSERLDEPLSASHIQDGGRAAARPYLSPAQLFAHDFDEGADFSHQLAELFGFELLPAVAEGGGGIGMHFDQQSVRAHGDSGAS
jgi:hypothetical protein